MSHKVAIVGTVSASMLGFRASLVAQLARKGHRVLCFCTDLDASSRAGIRALGAEPVAYRLSRAGLNPISDLASVLELRRLLKTHQPDVVFSYFAKPVIWGSLAAWMARVPRRVAMLEGLGYVFTPGVGGVFTRKQRILQRVQGLLYGLSMPRLHRMIFLNPDGPKDLIDRFHIRAKDVKVLGGIGVDLNKFACTPPPVTGSGLAGKSLTFIFVARLLAEKGVHEYVAAARLVKARFPLARFVMLGGLDKENPGGLKQHDLDQLKADGLIEHPGFVTNVQDWLRDADVFVLPSYREGVPASTQEAMATGRAVLTTDVPGCRETVEDGRNGYLIPPWDADALAAKMMHLIKHPELVVEMGRESRRMAEERYNVHEVNDRLIKLILED